MSLMIAMALGGLLLAPSESKPAQSLEGEGIGFRQAIYGPSWGHYKDFLGNISDLCGPDAKYCEVFCPKQGMNAGAKKCRVIYSCGSALTRSVEYRSGDLMIFDCRVKSGI